MKTRPSPRSPDLFSPDARESDYPSVRTCRVPVRIYLISSGPTQHIRISAYSDRMLRKDCIVLYRNFSYLWNIQDTNPKRICIYGNQPTFFPLQYTYLPLYLSNRNFSYGNGISLLGSCVHTVNYKSRHVSSCRTCFTLNSNIYI